MTEKHEKYKVYNNLILALDASTTAVGWCYADGDAYSRSGVYKPHGDVWQRIYSMGGWLTDSLYRFTPSVVAIEEPCGDSGNRRTDRLLGAVLGVAVYCTMFYTDAEVVLINPSSVKATGFCKATPMETALLVGKDEVSGDEADAIGVWQAYLVKMREGSK